MVEQRLISQRPSQGIAKVEWVGHTWNGITVRLVEKHLQPGIAWADMSADSAVIVVCLYQRGGYFDARLKLEHATARSRLDPGFAVWVPPNRTVFGYSEDARLIRNVRLTFEIDRAAALLGEEFDFARLRDPIPMLYDGRVTRCARLLADACADPETGGPLYAESLTTALLSAFFHAAQRRSPGKPAGGLDALRLRRATEYLRGNWGAGLSLATLAGMSELSESQFARAFRTSTGLPPYQWALQAKIQKAQELLVKAEAPIAVIAMDVGFADQSHFTKAFKRLTGTTPRRWQRDRRS